MQYADGSEYDGPWRNDARSGRGKFIWKDGAGVYEGDFLDDQMHGEGRLKWASGAEYSGQWRYNKKQG